MDWMTFAISVTAILVGGAIFIVPLVSIALRRSLKPMIEAWAKTKQETHDAGAIKLIEERMARGEKAVVRVVEDTEKED